MHFSKKADISIQFNWIFILVAGIVLLAFFVGITVWQGEKAREQRNLKTTQNMEATITNAEQSVLNSKSVMRSFKIQESELNIYCNEFSEIRIKNSAFSVDLQNKILFSRENLNAGTLYLWISNWEVPFKVAPFVFMDDGSTMFVFVNNTAQQGALTSLYKSFVYNISKEITNNIGSFEDRGFRHYRIVFYNQTKDYIENVQLYNFNDFSAVNILPGKFASFGEYGMVEFYGKKGDLLKFQGEKPFLMEDSLFGAIFSQDHNFYECAMKKAVFRLNWVSQAYAYKAKKLKEKYEDLGNDCKEFYFWPDVYAEKLGLTTFSNESFVSAFENSVALNKFNTDLTKVYRCATLY